MMYKMPDGTMVIVSGEKMTMVAESHGWERVVEQAGTNNAVPKFKTLALTDEVYQSDNDITIISGKTNRRATTAEFSIDPTTGRIITKQGE